MKPEPPRMRRRPLFHARDADAWPILYGVMERIVYFHDPRTVFFCSQA